MSEAKLQLEAVDKIYNAGGARQVHAVRSLDMTVAPGEIVALLGSSGCGKTSTLRMIAGFEEATRGSIRLDGREIHRLAPAKRNVAMAFEGYSLYPPLTVRENIAFALKSSSLSKTAVAERVGEMAHMLEIEDVLDRYPSSISGGQQQRASLGRALIRDAGLYLLDEPMGQLEPQLRALLRGRIKFYIKERGLTAILVTHDQTEANALADRIAVMEDGVLQQFDSPAHLKDRPANLFTGTFIGEPPMNVFEAEVRADSGRLRFGLSGGVVLDYAEEEFSEALRRTLAQKLRVTLGVRPHAVRLAAEGAPAEVTANQWLGDQTHIAARFAGGSIVTVEHHHAPYAKGETIGVVLGSADLHVFDSQTGAAISHGGALA
ncbi:ABC transporter ATP-binding protein [Pelagibius sp.]|uniref:ABC transporter ATP-binding protein n=1 Tax=Pelagibius sp. TaxID=1931238 RepID=UPI00262DE431|nr:ABC transporter ATP-binding protein [Pelagibius sp.]